MKRPIATAATVLAGLGLVSASVVVQSGATAAPPRDERVSQVTGPTVVAVGDIACAPNDTKHLCEQKATADLARTYDPRHVLALGDLQYESGTLRSFQRSYDESWGSLKAITKPVPGNHEYRTGGASGYYGYFEGQQPGAPGYYAFDIDDWRIYALNTNCSKIKCARQVRWLAQDMVDHPRECSAVTMHHPRFSSGGEHGSSLVAKRFWDVAYAHGVDLALAGHDHDYERFRGMAPDGSYDEDGIVSFVSGAGGKSLYEFGNIESGSLFRDNDASGVLALTLGTGEFGFEYQTVDDRVIDSGVRTCG